MSHRQFIRHGLGSVVLVMLSVPTASADTFVVAFNNDSPDLNPGNCICDTSETVLTNCGIRAAIEEANACAGIDTIEFSRNGVNTVTLDPVRGPLPEITETVIIDGTTAPDYDNTEPEPEAPPPQFYLDGNELTTSGADGLRFGSGADGSVVRAIGLISFPDEGLHALSADGLIVQGCYIGVTDHPLETQPNGTEPFGTTAGVLLESNANQIGQAFDGDGFIGRGNVISGNAVSGIVIDAGNDNRVRGNLIGIGADGFSPKPNDGYGVRVMSGTGNGIGAFTNDANAGNVIATNLAAGVRIDDDSNYVRGNHIGALPSGLGAGNEGNGVELFSSGNVVGGAAATAVNVIANSGSHGIQIGSDTIAANANIIRNNAIGLDVDHVIPFGNSFNGIGLVNGSDNSIRDNVIGAHDRAGVRVDAPDNTLTGNIIGTNGEHDDLGNFHAGIRVSAGGNQIGGEADGEENILGFNLYGISLAPGSDGTVVQGNYIGTDPAGHDIGNSINGISIVSSGNNMIGGTLEEGNVISGNGTRGIELNVPFNGDPASNNEIRGNLIGVDPSGSSILPNEEAGIRVSGASNTVIGAPRNVISGNRWGVRLIGAGTTGTRIAINFIGVGADGETPAGNSSHGVLIDNQASASFVGGAGSAAGNRIAHNGGSGVALRSNAGNGNLILRNRMFANADQGIDLGEDGPTDNDPGDEDSGPNRLQNHPELASARLDPDTGEVTAVFAVPTLETNAAYPLTVAFYRDDGDGQGEIFLGSVDYAAAEAGEVVQATFAPEAAVSPDDRVVATAMDDDHNTSEFSPASKALGVIFQDRFEDPM